jgi:hypothetical protein
MMSIEMFKVITKKNATQHRQDLKDLLSIDSALSLPTTEEEVLLVCDHPDYGLIGGARLSQANQSDVLKKHLKHLEFIQDTPCLIDGIFFHVASDNPVQQDEEAFEQLCQDFYKGLYEALQLYAQQYQLDTLLSLASVEEHNDLLYFGEWSFLAQYRCEESDEDEELILGLLKFKRIDELRLSA